MDTQMQAAILALLEKTLTSMDAAQSFMAAQLPEMITQLLQWHLIKQSTLLVLGLFMVGGCIKAISLTVFAIKKAKRTGEDNWAYANSSFGGIEPPAVILFTAVGCTLLGLLLEIKTSILIILQIWLVPKIWLLDYVFSLK